LFVVCPGVFILFYVPLAGGCASVALSIRCRCSVLGVVGLDQAGKSSSKQAGAASIANQLRSLADRARTRYALASVWARRRRQPSGYIADIAVANTVASLLDNC